MLNNLLFPKEYQRYLSLFPILFFLIAVNFVGSASKIAMGTVAIFFLFFMLKQRRRIPWDPITITMLLFSVFSFISAVAFYSLREIIQVLFWFMSFCVGRWACMEAKNKQAFCVRVSAAITLGYGMNILINYLFNLFFNPRIGVRVAFSVWNGEQVAVTYWGVIAILFAAGVYYFVVEHDNKYIKALYLLMAAATVGFGVASATRSMLLSVLAVVFVCALLKLYLVKFDWKRYRKLFLGLLTVVLLIGILFVIFFKTLMKNPLVARLFSEGILDSSRAELFVYYVSHLIKYPFGGRNVLQEYTQASHNVFLDVYDSYGVIPFILLVVFVILVVISIVYKILCRSKSTDLNNKPNIAYLYTGCIVAFLIVCFIEPCTYSNISSIWVMLFLFGSIIEEITAERKEMEVA